MHQLWPFLLQDTFQNQVDHFAGHLSGEHEEDFDFAGGPDEGCVDDTEPLRDEG